MPHYMRLALQLARRNMGITAPNPSVGCVIVKDGIIVGRGVTARGGRPHAETIALKQAGDNAKGASCYVTLEPCAHHGKTPPCVEALIHAQIAHVVIAVRDPHDHASGGIERLQTAGITVECGVLETEAKQIMAGFFSKVMRNRPFVTLKMAVSLDGKIAAKPGLRTALSGDESKAFTHLLRYQHDGIMVGMNTAITDDPQLTCRLPGLEQDSPQRFVVGNHTKLQRHHALVKTAHHIPSYCLSSHDCDPHETEDGLTLRPTQKNADGTMNLQQMLQDVAAQNVNSLLVEGGQKLASSLLNAGLIDQIIWTQTPCYLGRDGVDALGDIRFGLTLTKQWSRMLGDDVVSGYTL